MADTSKEIDKSASPEMDTSKGYVSATLPKENGALMKYHHSLGARVPPGCAIDHLSDDTLIYLVGKHVAIFQHETVQHRFILKNQKTSEIVTFCISPNRKYIALAERLAEGSLVVNIYTQHTGSRVRSLDFKFLSKLPVVAMDFSTDNKYLATVTALPDVYIYLWQVDKSRLIGMIDVPFELTKITVSPWAYWTLCTTGPSSLKLWRLVDKNLKQIDPMPSGKKKDGTMSQSYRYTSHAWYDEDKLVTSTEEGDILVVENSELKKTLRAVHGEGCAISTITIFARGFVCGGDGGMISLFERTFDETNYFKLLKRFNPVNISRVMDISVSPKEESLVALFQNNTLTSVSLENLELPRESDALGLYSNLSVGYHNDTVTAVAVCVQKCIVVTGSLDKTVRVWNYMRRKVEFIKQFDEEVLSLALHPTGLRVVIGFKSYLRMYNILSTDLHFCNEWAAKPCFECRFSNGGHLLAAVVAHRVLIFDAYAFHCTAQLSGHTVMIRSVCWSPNDQSITTADLNGVIYCWEIDGQKRVEVDEIRKNMSFTCVMYDDKNKATAAIGTCKIPDAGMAEGDVTIRCLIPSSKQDPVIVRPHPGVFATKLPAQRKQHTSEIVISPLAQTLFVGTCEGALLLYKWPLVEGATPYQRIEVHNGEILFVVLSWDERYLFTVGEDNAMFLFELDAIQEGRSVAPKQFNYANFEEVCYTKQSDIEEKSRELAALQQELEDLHTAKAHSETTLTQKYEMERVTKEEEFQNQLESLRNQLNTALTAKEEAEQALVENARHLESMHLKAAEELEALYSKRAEEANTRYQMLKTERDDLLVRYENRLFKLGKEHEAERRKLEDKSKEAELKLCAELESVKTKMTCDKDAAEGMLDFTITDYENMVDELNSKYKQVIIKKEEDLSRAVNNGSTGERDANRLREEKRELLRQLQERERKIVDLDQLCEKRKKENDSLRTEMKVRFESISTAEKKIQQLKKQTTELEKLRYVLTFKFNELKKEVAPKDKQIGFMTERVQEMDHELEKVATDREQLKQALESKEEKMRVLQNEISGQRRSLDDKERVINTMLRELTEVIGNTDTKRLVYQVKDVITRYNTRQQREEAVLETDRTAEFERQREYMEAQLSAVKRQNRQKESNLRLENQRNTSENAVLVKEINELRHEKKVLTTKCQLVESQLKEARLALQRATAASPGQAGTASSEPRRSRLGEQEGETPVPPSRRGKLVRGPTRAIRDMAQFDADRIARVIAQVERNNAEMERQQEEILRLREFVSHLLSRAESERTVGLSEDERQRHEDIKRHLQQASTMTPAVPPEQM